MNWMNIRTNNEPMNETTTAPTGANSVTTALMRVSIPDPVEVMVLPAGEQAKELVLSKSVLITEVTTPLHLEGAVSWVKDAKKLLKETEGFRKELKAPVLNLGKRIDRVADEFAKPIDAEVARVQGLITAFTLAEQRRVQEEERQRQLEIARLMAEQEAKRLEAEVAKAKAEMAEGSDEMYDAIETSVDAQIAAERASEQARSVITAPLPEAVRVKGMMSKPKIEWEVTDIQALYKAAPHLCRLEPNAAAIRATVCETTKLPGLRVWATDRVIVRA